jgi:hypothetical protein
MSSVHITLCETIPRKITRILRAQFAAASKSEISLFMYPIALGMHLKQINVNFKLFVFWIKHRTKKKCGKAKV